MAEALFMEARAQGGWRLAAIANGNETTTRNDDGVWLRTDERQRTPNALIEGLVTELRV